LALKRAFDGRKEPVVTFLTNWLLQTWDVLLQAGPWLVVGFLLAGFIHVLIPVDKVTRHLGRPGLGGVLKAAIIGAPLPLCSCSVIPVASAIRRQGASRGATASFLVSTPETGVDSIAASYALLGPFMAIIRPIAAIVTAVVAGLAIDRLGGETPATSNQLEEGSSAPDCHATASSQSCCGARSAAPSHDSRSTDTYHASADQQQCHDRPVQGTSCCAMGSSHVIPATGPATWPSRIAGKIADAVRYGYGRMFEDLAHWLVLGFALAGLVAALFPPDLLDRYIGAGPWTMLLMLAVGLPMYVCATASTPVAAVLIAKGLSPGAALVFLLAGPATNAATMAVVARDLGRKSLVLYLASIAVVAVLFGLFTDYLVGLKPMFERSIHQHVHGESATFAWPFAVVLLLLILNGLRVRIGKRLAASTASREAVTASSACCEHQ